jgi:RES domain-containing protein
MPFAWRLAPPAFARSLDGEGSRIAGGRWNSPGRQLVYASSHLSLSVLEVYVHIAPALRDEIPEFEAARISVPDDVSSTDVSMDQFERLMTGPDSLKACQSFGDDWIFRGTNLVLRAPSFLVPEDVNIMLNPAHPRMREVVISSTRPFRFDPRLATGQP